VPKVLTVFILIGLVFNLTIRIINNTLTAPILVAATIAIIIFSLLLFYLNTRKVVEYDDVKQVLYILSSKDILEFEVPVEKINEIVLSTIGFDRLGYSYVIIFNDFQNQKQKIRFFTIPFHRDIDTLIADTKYKNPNLIARPWSFE